MEPTEQHWRNGERDRRERGERERDLSIRWTTQKMLGTYSFNLLVNFQTFLEIVIVSTRRFMNMPINRCYP